jgi:hypothetical protein
MALHIADKEVRCQSTLHVDFMLYLQSFEISGEGSTLEVGHKRIQMLYSSKLSCGGQAFIAGMNIHFELKHTVMSP